MTTFFPHLYEYGRIMNLLKNYESNENDVKGKQRKRYLKEEEGFCVIPESLSKSSLNFNQYHQSTDLDFLIYLEMKAQKLRESNYNPLKFYNVPLETVIKARTELSNINKYKKPPEWPLKAEILDSQYANEGEFPSRHWIVVDTILCIEIAKTLPFFDKLNIFDQQELLKSTILLNALFTEAYYSFVAFYDTLIFPDGKMPIKFPNLHKWQIDIFKRIIEPIKRIKITKEEYVLLKTIIFCSSKSDEISAEGKNILKKEFHHYSRLLLNHLQAKYGNAPGAVRYSQILSVMEAMIYFAQKGKEFYIFLGVMRNLPPHPTMALMDQIIHQ